MMSDIPWSTVSFVKDKPENIRRFVSYHLGMGAAKMYLFFDDPDDPSIEMLSDLERVAAIRCDRAFWKNLLNKEVINRHGRRQNSSTTFGYTQVTNGWVLNLDADEFLHMPNQSVSEFLAAQPDSVRAIRIRPAEQVLNDWNGRGETFRMPLGPFAVKDVHGSFSEHMQGRGGFFGHIDGKSFIRSGLSDVRLRQHWPISGTDGPLMDHDVPATGELCVLHRNAEEYDIWRSKLKFRLDSMSIPSGLRTWFQEKHDAGDEEGLQQGYDAVFRVSPRQAEVLRQNDCLLELEEPLSCFEKDYFPSAAPL